MAMATMVQGQSTYTWFKELRFTPVMVQSLRISKALSVQSFPYYHVDLNAGGGYNHDVQVAGSPVNFLRAVERERRRNVFCFFVDHSPQCIRELTVQPEVLAFPSDRLAIYQADNAEVLSVVSAHIVQHERNPHHAIGSILIDPNGYHKGVPWEALRIFCARYRKIDVLINLNVTTFRWERGHIRRGIDAGWQKYRLQPISEFSGWFSRPHWMLTDIYQSSGHAWVQCVGRTIRTVSNDYRSLGFYDSQSDRGRDIIAKIENRTTDSDLPFL